MRRVMALPGPREVSHLSPQIALKGTWISRCHHSAIMRTRASTTLADLLTPLLDTNPFSTVRASFRWQLSNERDNGVADGRQAWLRRRSIDSFFPASLF